MNLIKIDNFNKNLRNKIFELDFQFFSEGGGYTCNVKFCQKSQGGYFENFQTQGGILAIRPPLVMSDIFITDIQTVNIKMIYFFITNNYF